MKRKWIFMKIVKVLFFVCIGIFLFGLITMSLWNCLIPALFHGPVVTYWQAVGLLILGKILFGGFGGRRGGPWGRGQGHGGPWGRWHEMSPEERTKYKEEWKKWKDKWDTMSLEEKRQAKMQFKGNCGPWGNWNRPGFDFDQTKDEQNTQTA